jgi:hypothetical protein
MSFKAHSLANIRLKDTIIKLFLPRIAKRQPPSPQQIHLPDAVVEIGRCRRAAVLQHLAA